MFHAFSILTILWLFLEPLPAREQPAKDFSKDPLRAYVLKTQGRQAYGLYINNRKIGWSLDETRLGKYKGKDVAIRTEEAYFAVTLGGKKMTTKEKGVTFFELGGQGRIIFAEERTIEDDKETVRITATCHRNAMVITTRTARRKTQRRVPLFKQTLSQERQLDEWLQGRRKRGDTFQSYSFSLDEPEVNTKEIYTFQVKKFILWGGVPTEVYLVQIRSDGMVMEAVLKPDGTLLKGSLQGVELRAEKEKIAKVVPRRDLMPVFLIDKDLGDAEKVASLTLKVSGLGNFTLPASHRQRVQARKDGTVLLELCKDYRVQKPTPLGPEQRTKYTRATPELQSNSERIRRLAKKIIRKERNPVKAATLLQKWV